MFIPGTDINPPSIPLPDNPLSAIVSQPWFYPALSAIIVTVILVKFWRTPVLRGLMIFALGGIVIYWAITNSVVGS